MKADQIWFAVRVLTTPAAAEAVEVAFNSLDSIGTEINNLGKKIEDLISVVGYFEKQPELKTVEAELAKSLRIYNLDFSEIKDIAQEEIPSRDWLSEWKKHWTPTETDRFVISPPWLDNPGEEKTVIRIEPKMAFGTGTHETTKLCLRAIERKYKPGMSFLDVGTGTGILAIAAAKVSSGKGARIVGCDTDAESVEAATENADINGVHGIKFYVGPISEATPESDFVCANMTADIIEPIIPLLLAKAKQFLVLSGILETQKDEIIGELKLCGIENPKIEVSGEWISVIIENKRRF